MSSRAAALKLNGRDYVVLPREDYERLAGLAKAGKRPLLPERDADGNYPAVEYARASLARKLIRDRVNAGLTQRELANLSGVRHETLCRLEAGRHTPSVATIAKIDRALRRAARETTGHI